MKIVRVAANCLLLAVAVAGAVVYWKRDVASPMVELLKGLPVPAAADSGSVQSADSETDFAPLDADAVLALRGALQRSQFDSLDEVLGGLERAALADSRSEDRWGWVLKGLGYVGPDGEAAMDAWIAARPESHTAHLVRASAHIETGFYFRGSAFASKTTRAQFAGMVREFDLAEQQIALALRADPRAVAGYWLLLTIAQGRSEPAGAREALRRALLVRPRSVRSRVMFMLLLEPKWGGSIQSMTAFANSADSKTAEEPRLKLLHGFVAWGESHDAASHKQHAEAVAAARRALTFGEDWHFHDALATALWDIDDIRGATEEFEKAAQLNPIEPFVRYHRSQLMYDRAHGATNSDSAAAWLTESRADAQTAFYINGANAGIHAWFDTLATLKWNPR
jgi:tetratricopeptide (TPR) repeat protein